MRFSSLTWIAAALTLLGAISCAASEKPGPITGSGGAGGGVVPARACTMDAQCGSGSACFGNLCVARATDLGNWAIEIDPPSSSGAQVTEIVSPGQAPLTATAAMQFSVPFASLKNSGAIIPAIGSAILTVPSQIPGRRELAFDTRVQAPTPTATMLNAVATLDVPEAIRSRSAMVSLIPLSPSDQETPPLTFPVTIPEAGATLPTQILPETLLAVHGQLLDTLGDPKGQFTARAFLDGRLVSTTGSTSGSTPGPAGNFSVILPASLRDKEITLELTPTIGGSDPSIVFDPLRVGPDTNLGTITLPAYAVPNAFRVAVTGSDRTPVSGATVRAYTAFTNGDPRASTRFVLDSLTSSEGNAPLSIIPGDTDAARPYTLSVAPAPGSPWASQCITNILVPWIGVTVTATLRVELVRRPVFRGNVVSANGTPVGNVVVTATRGAVPKGPCLAGPTSTSTTTDAGGAFSLPLDAGIYQIDYKPPAGSPVPRWTQLDVTIAADAEPRTVSLPPAVLVEGDVRAPDGTDLGNAAIRIFEPRCATADGCIWTPHLLGETLSDEVGHFRVIVPAPGAY